MMDPQDYSSIEVEIKNKPLVELLSQFDPYEYDLNELPFNLYVFHVEDDSLFYYIDEGSGTIGSSSKGIVSEILSRILGLLEDLFDYLELDLDKNTVYQGLTKLNLDSIFPMTERIESTYSISTPLDYLFDVMGSSYISQEDVKKKSAENGINIDFNADWILYSEKYTYDRNKRFEKLIISVEKMEFEIFNKKF